VYHLEFADSYSLELTTPTVYFDKIKIDLFVRTRGLNWPYHFKKKLNLSVALKENFLFATDFFTFLINLNNEAQTNFYKNELKKNNPDFSVTEKLIFGNDLILQQSRFWLKQNMSWFFFIGIIFFPISIISQIVLLVESDLQ
jgi:hypothetical protein